MSTSSSQSEIPNPQSDGEYTVPDATETPTGEAPDRQMSGSDLEKQDRAARRKRHIRLFCFSCNRYEGHSVSARNRLLYSFVIGFTFGLYYILGRYSCHCCGSVRLARRDWLNPRFWYRTLWLGGVAKPKTSGSKSRRKG